MEEIINNNPSLILKKDTSRKMALGGMVEDLSYSQIDRMEGLYPNEEMDTFLNTANFIIKDMENEGFEKDEVISFLAYKIVQDTKKKYSTQSIKASEFEPVGSYHDMSSKSWTQEDQNALEGWMSDIRYGYGWITPDYVETSWTGRPGSGTKEWNRDIQKRVFQGLINEELLWTENKNEPGEQGYEITSIEDALKMMAKGGGIPNKYREAIYNMEDWMPDNMQLMDEYNYFLESGDVDGLTSFIEEYGDEETLAERYDITYTEYETLANTAINM
jgi:hypothetical protein